MAKFAVPAPDFRPPVQSTAYDLMTGQVVYMVPVSVKKAWLRREIPCCEACIDLGGETRSLVWQGSRGAYSGDYQKDVTLIAGKERHLFLVSSQGGDAELLDSYNLYFELHPSTKNVLTFKARTEPYSLKVKIKSGTKEWESPTYLMYVPEAGRDRGTFRVEVA